MRLRSLAISAAILLTGISSNAHDHSTGDIRIERAYARPTVSGQTSGAAYLTIENKGKNADKLVSITSPAAKSAQIHTMSMDGNIMRMREVPTVEIKPAEKIVMKPGDGYHIMLIGVHKPLNVGDRIPLTLTFEKSGKAEVSAAVEDNKPKAAKEHQSHHHKH
jgi:copper(I)-binding protein